MDLHDRILGSRVSASPIVCSYMKENKNHNKCAMIELKKQSFPYQGNFSESS